MTSGATTYFPLPGGWTDDGADIGSGSADFEGKTADFRGKATDFGG